MSDLVFRLHTAQCMHSSIMNEAADKIVTLAELTKELYSALKLVNSEEIWESDILDNALDAYERVFHG